MNPTIERAAAAAHEANRLYCEAIGDPVPPTWALATEAHRSSFRAGVRVVGKGGTARDGHRSWMTQKLAEGWELGPVKSETAKTHPCLVPYDALPEKQKVKDDLFRAVVLAMLGAMAVCGNPACAILDGEPCEMSDGH